MPWITRRLAAVPCEKDGTAGAWAAASACWAHANWRSESIHPGNPHEAGDHRLGKLAAAAGACDCDLTCTSGYHHQPGRFCQAVCVKPLSVSKESEDSSEP